MIYSQWLFGPVEFAEGEDYFRFRFRLLAVLLLSGVLTSGLFAVMSMSGLNPIHNWHVQISIIHSLLSAILLLLLRGQRQRYLWVAWSYGISCLGIFTSALLFVTTDEFRLVWFVINLAGFYILLGRGPGIGVTLFSMVLVGYGNSLLSAPFSPNAMTTFYVAMLYNSIFFYVYSGRSFSFYLQLLAANQQLHEMASRDPLTGQLNARAYYGLCDRLIQNAQRSHTPFAVLFVDLDHFKAINDNYGHDAGDAVLKAVATTLAQGCRHSDILGRIGGEEFSLFLPNTDLPGAQALAEKLRQDVEQLRPSIGPQQLRITASIGLSSRQHDYPAMAHIQKEADQAMYHAKAQGRNRVSCWQDPVSTGQG